MSAMMIYVTASSPAEATEIARKTVQERLAACANILGAIKSYYWWQGAVQEEGEVAIVLKTDSTLVERLTARIKALHSYTVPCIVALPIVAGNPEFLRWIGEETVEAQR
jgi:periplasmic divalent cation tolerance protein